MSIDNAENQRRLEAHLAYCREVFASDEICRAWPAIADGGGRPCSPTANGSRRKRSPSPQPVHEAPDADLLTVIEAAKYLRVSVSAIRRLQQRRLIAFVKIGGSLRFTRADLAVYVEKRRVKPIDQYEN